MKIVTVVGARPQFIKASAISRMVKQKFKDEIEEVLVHTGQHFDGNMSKIFFDELGIPEPKYNLAIMGGSHGIMTGRMIEAIEEVLLIERPNWVLVYGDTNSTLAGAISAVKLGIPIAHVEAGLRSFNMRMPEEINRILTDRISTLLFCPTKTAVEHLYQEGIERGVVLVGDVMMDVLSHYSDLAKQKSKALDHYGLMAGQFVLATCHRAENTDDPNKLRKIFQGFALISKEIPVVLSLHPRVEKILNRDNLWGLVKNILIVPPLSYLDMLAMEQASEVIFTDSGGVQKEAYFLGVPCVTFREETEWVETLQNGWNRLVKTDPQAFQVGFKESKCINKIKREHVFGNGDSSLKILESILVSNAESGIQKVL